MENNLIDELNLKWNSSTYREISTWYKFFNNLTEYYDWLDTHRDFNALWYNWSIYKLDWLKIQDYLYNYYSLNITGTIYRICPKCGEIKGNHFISHLKYCDYSYRDYVKYITGSSGLCLGCGKELDPNDSYSFNMFCSDSCRSRDHSSRWTYETHYYKSKTEVDEHNKLIDARDKSGLDYGRDLVNARRSSGDEYLLEVSRRNIKRAHMANSYEYCEEFGYTKDELYNKLANRDMSVQINAMHEANLLNGHYSSDKQSIWSNCASHESRVLRGLKSLESRFDGRLGKKSIYCGYEMSSLGELLGTIIYQLENPTSKLVGSHKRLPNLNNNSGSSYTDSVFKDLDGNLINVEVHDKSDITSIENKKYCSEINNYIFVLIDNNVNNLIKRLCKLGYRAGRLVEHVSECNANKIKPVINLEDWKY